MAVKVVEYREGDDGPEVKVDNGGDVFVAEHFAPPGCDAPPLPGDFAAVSDAPGAGGSQATGYNDTKNTGKAKPGEVRHYARDASGAIVGEWWVKGDGTFVFENAGGTFEISPDGKLKADVPEAEFTGDLKVEGNITAGASIEAGGEITWNAKAAPTKASTHTHPTAMGPSGPPIPGT